MRAVADTNIVISGLLWPGAPRDVLLAARSGRLTLFTSWLLLAELADVLSRPKFAARLARADVSANELMLGYAALAQILDPEPLEPVVASDPDDDAVLACARAAAAEAIITGDQHLLRLGRYDQIPILTATEALARLG